MKLQFFDRSNGFLASDSSANDKELIAFFTMLTLLIFMVVKMTSTPVGF